MKSQSFERFYYTKVGLGEGCGCAERIIDVHEINRLAGPLRILPRVRAKDTLRALRRFFGITKRRGPASSPTQPTS